MAKPDPVKVRVNTIIDGVVSAYKENDTERAFKVAAGTLVREAYELGVKVGKGQLPDDTEPTA